jgi:hypothetical protein
MPEEKTIPVCDKNTCLLQIKRVILHPDFTKANGAELLAAIVRERKNQE